MTCHVFVVQAEYVSTPHLNSESIFLLGVETSPAQFLFVQPLGSMLDKGVLIEGEDFAVYGKLIHEKGKVWVLARLARTGRKADLESELVVLKI